MAFSPSSISDRWRIPLEDGQAVSPGWPMTGGRPLAVTWHWTATATLEECNQLLGGANAERRGQASAHYAIGRRFEEGVERYVSLENRSWHAGKEQTLRFDGHLRTLDDEKASRTSIGIETVNLGYARPQVPADATWIAADTLDGARHLLVQPWTEPQIDMMIGIGREILGRWPHLGPRVHHGHHDLCPGYKLDVAGFPFARVLRGIYDDPSIPDVWSSVWTVRGRRRALEKLGFPAGNAVDADWWTRADDLALRTCQESLGLPPNGLWTTALSWAIDDATGTDEPALVRSRG